MTSTEMTVPKALSVNTPVFIHKETEPMPEVPSVSYDLNKMLRNPEQIRNAIVAAEILGKPVSLR